MAKSPFHITPLHADLVPAKSSTQLILGSSRGAAAGQVHDWQRAHRMQSTSVRRRNGSAGMPAAEAHLTYLFG